MSVPFVDSSGLYSLGGPIISCVGLPINVSRGTGQLRVVTVSSATVASVASVFSPGSLLFPFSDSGFASLSASSSSHPFALPPPPPPLSSSVALSSSSVSALASSSFSSSLPFPPSLPPPPSFPSSLPPPPSFRSQLTPLSSSSSFPSSSSFSASAALLAPPGFPPLPPPPGFAPLPPPLSPPPSRRRLPSLCSPLIFLLAVSPFLLVYLLRLFRLPPPLLLFLRWILLPIRLPC